MKHMQKFWLGVFLGLGYLLLGIFVTPLNNYVNAFSNTDNDNNSIPTVGAGDDDGTYTNVSCTKNIAYNKTKRWNQTFKAATFGTNVLFCDINGKDATTSKWQDGKDGTIQSYGAGIDTSKKQGLGGASWHIFKIPENIQETFCYRSSNKCKVKEKGLYLRETDANYNSMVCGSNYFATYVYDGWYGPGVGMKSYTNKKSIKPIYYGPLGWNKYVATPGKGANGPKHSPFYNNSSYGVVGVVNDYSVLRSLLMQGKNNIKIKGSCTKNGNDGQNGCKDGTYKSPLATKLYNEWQNKNLGNVPKGTGWFCIPSSMLRLFLGQSTVTSGGASQSTGYISEGSKTVTLPINCSSVTGCTAIFTHYIKKENTPHNYTSDYKISRSSNLQYNSATNKGINSNSNLKSGTSSGGLVRSETLTLYPGMVVCESMNFKVDNQGTRATTTVCAIANGSVPTGVDIKVKNNDVLAFKEYAKEVYAKPNHIVEFQATYDPILQYTTEIRPWSMQIDGGNWISNPTGEKLQILFNNRGNKPAWKNAFSISSANFQKDPFNQDYLHPKGVGNTEKYTPNSNTHQIQFGEVGISSPSEEAKVNDTSGTQTTPTQINFHGNNVANVITTPPIKSTANVWVPYNFDNTTKITDDPETKPLYAGEEAFINFEVTVGRKINHVISDYYATRVDGAKKKLEIYVNGTRYETTEVSMGTINNDPTCLERDCTYPTNSREGYELKFNVPDVPAGTKVCLRSMVWPKYSGDDKNVKIEGYSPDWAVSDQVCFTVAKKPSIQLWGGNVYSAGDIKTSVAKKSLLAGHNFTRNKYDPDPTSPQWIFGSFGELGLIATGRVENLASGASTGYASYNNNTDQYGLWPSTHPSDGGWGNNGSGFSNRDAGRKSGGSETDKFCKHSPLSFANDKCSNSGVGNLASNNNLTKATTDKQKIINNLAVPSDSLDQRYLATDGFAINDRDKTHITSNGSYYYYSPNALNFAGGTIGRETTQMVHSKEDITITDNVYYDTSKRYSKLHDIPNLIIYAEGNITINCDVAQPVTHLDALIIAEGTVKTCHSDNINAEENSSQLVINGAVVAGKLVANRTYGAGIGNNSIIPAEIINFNPALYLWNATNIDEDKNENKNEIKDLDTVKLTEVAPRY